METKSPLGTNRPRLTVRVTTVTILAALLFVAVLAITVLITVLVSRNETTGDVRTVTVSGQASIKATPDEFVFYPSYTFNNTDKEAALAAMTAKSDEVVAGLKKIGITDNAIKTDSSGYDAPRTMIAPAEGGDTANYYLQLTVTADSFERAQKVQDYLITTTPTGSVSPQASFSTEKRKQLEDEARDKASKDARAKAEQSAKNLGFAIDKVQSVEDGNGFGDVPYVQPLSGAAEDKTVRSSLAVQPGENSLDYTVTVTYSIR